MLPSLNLILGVHPKMVYMLLHQLCKEEELNSTALGARDKEPKHFYRSSFMSLLKVFSNVKVIAKSPANEAEMATAITLLVNLTPI